MESVTIILAPILKIFLSVKHAEQEQDALQHIRRLDNCVFTASDIPFKDGDMECNSVTPAREALRVVCRLNVAGPARVFDLATAKNTDIKVSKSNCEIEKCKMKNCLFLLSLSLKADNQTNKHQPIKTGGSLSASKLRSSKGMSRKYIY